LTEALIAGFGWKSSIGQLIFLDKRAAFEHIRIEFKLFAKDDQEL
jgi:hypothetical protein